MAYPIVITRLNGIDEEIKDIKTSLDTKLPKTGGTISGNLTVSNLLDAKTIEGKAIYGPRNSDLAFNYGRGAWLSLVGDQRPDVEGEQGMFKLFANRFDADVSSSLLGYPNGTLTWGGRHVLRLESSGKNSDGTQWYRKYSDGYIEQGGVFLKNMNGSNYYTTTFLVPFSDTNYCGFLLPTLNDSASIILAMTGYYRGTTNLYAYLPDKTFPVGGANAFTVNFFACGY